jgi:hypothetical protein
MRTRQELKCKKYPYSYLEKTQRWNMCQYIAKHIYDSALETQELEILVKDLQEEVGRLVIDIK